MSSVGVTAEWNRKNASEGLRTTLRPTCAAAPSPTPAASHQTRQDADGDSIHGPITAPLGLPDSLGDAQMGKGKKTQKSAGGLPKNWPKDIEFLTDHIYSDAVTKDQISDLCRSTYESQSYSKIAPETILSPCPLVAIKQIIDESHPAYGQSGLFAPQDLEPNTFICLYLGLVHTNDPADTDPHSDYDLNLDRELGLSLDAANCGTEARFANDYRGIAERPNAEFRDCFVQVPSDKRVDGTKWERRVGIFVLSAGKAGKRKRGIKAGEEITVTYGKGYWSGRDMLAT